MNARFLRPFARAAFRAPTAVRPAAMARPALAASQNKKTEVSPQQMVRKAPRTLRGECWETNQRITDGPQVCHAPAHPLLLRQRDHCGFYPPAIAYLRLLQVHPAPARAPVRCPPLHQQVVSEEGQNEVRGIWRHRAQDDYVPVMGICS
jgi:hypothetical protein